MREEQEDRELQIERIRQWLDAPIDTDDDTGDMCRPTMRGMALAVLVVSLCMIGLSVAAMALAGYF